MPASTLPTRSAPTSAPLVKMPPPSRAKIEISDAPKLSADHGFEHRAQVVAGHRRAQDEIIDPDPEQPEPDHQQPGHRAGLERDRQAQPRGRSRAACAVLTLARTETFMPI